ncbi:MAG: DsbA family protein [Verrucomicrobiales bacterium]|nr:DsbA family protein [Verrucomicrobiales bacterium]
MQVKVTYYLEVVSSWCYWAEPTWAELKRRFAGVVDFEWRVALMDGAGFPVSRAQEDWFYRRSGTLVRSPFMLNGDWLEPGRGEYLAPNALAEAAKDFGVTDDRVRLAIAEAAVRRGLKVGQWEVSAPVAAAAAGVEPLALLAKAQSPEIEKRLRASTAEFHGLKVTQRPTFLIEDEIGDRAVFSGLVQLEPLLLTVEAMRSDCAAYASWKAHFGDPPSA